MSKVYSDIEQRSEEWHEKRLGLFSPSRFGDMMSHGRSRTEKYGVSCYKYMREKLGELLTGNYRIIPINDDMQRGIDLEPKAIEEYTRITGNEVTQVGFIEYEPGICGGSPDGLVGDDGIIEVKCPRDYIHIDNLVQGLHTKQYIYQIQGYLMITGREWCDFVSYCEEMKDRELWILIDRIERDEEIISDLWDRVLECYGYVQNTYNKLLMKHGLL